jgi:hypothetical protein
MTSANTTNWKDEFFAFPNILWWEYLAYSGFCLFLICFAGLCSGLTLGLLSIDYMSLTVLLEAGTETEKVYAKRLEPILKKRHLLLVTLLLWVCILIFFPSVLHICVCGYVYVCLHVCIYIYIYIYVHTSV